MEWATRDEILTDGKISAKSAAFARMPPHMQMTVEGKPVRVFSEMRHQ